MPSTPPKTVQAVDETNLSWVREFCSDSASAQSSAKRTAMLRDTRSAVAAVVVELLVLLRLVGGERQLLLQEVLRERGDRDVRMCARLVLCEGSGLLRLVGP